MSTFGRNVSRTLLSNVIATGASASVNLYSSRFTLQSSGTVTANSGAATILCEVSNDNVNWTSLGNVSLTLGTVSTNNTITVDAKFVWVRANVTAISGTNATVSVIMGN
jgi:expansin (peptidoglycan-binding protein)